MKHCRFKALLALDTAKRPGWLECGPGEYRGVAVAAGREDHPGERQYFPAVIETDDDQPLVVGDARSRVVTIMVEGQEPAAFFTAGQGFSLWSSGGRIGHGTVSRRLFFPATR